MCLLTIGIVLGMFCILVFVLIMMLLSAAKIIHDCISEGICNYCWVNMCIGLFTSSMESAMEIKIKTNY